MRKLAGFVCGNCYDNCRGGTPNRFMPEVSVRLQFSHTETDLHKVKPRRCVGSFVQQGTRRVFCAVCEESRPGYFYPAKILTPHD